MKDIRIGARLLDKTPLFTLFAASVLAIAIGANITVFGFAKAVLWRALNVPRPDLFVRLYTPVKGQKPFFTDHSLNNGIFTETFFSSEEQRIQP